jgi:hypothetical protein
MRTVRRNALTTPAVAGVAEDDMRSSTFENGNLDRDRRNPRLRSPRNATEEETPFSELLFAFK